MKNIEIIDKNFHIKRVDSDCKGIKYDVTKPPFCIHGVFAPTKTDNQFCRLPNKVAKTVSDGVTSLSKHSAGGRVRFKTDSKYIAVEAVMGEICRMSHFTLTGSAGFDLYVGTKHINTFIPNYDITDKFFCEVCVSGEALTEYTLNLPLYSEVKELYIILDGNATVEAPDPYSNDKPVVFYGSSITQGGCASRPGTSYQAIISRRQNLDYINLGFSGNAKGEEEICNYINGLEMSALVMDYDHNAPNAEHLKATHEKFFKKIRENHKDLPIICVTRPFMATVDICDRKEVIRTTVNNAMKNGDKLVSFLDMNEYLKEKGVFEEASIDLCHPNDLGFYFMAEAIEKELKKFI